MADFTPDFEAQRAVNEMLERGHELLKQLPYQNTGSEGIKNARNFDSNYAIHLISLSQNNPWLPQSEYSMSTHFSIQIPKDAIKSRQSHGKVIVKTPSGTVSLTSLGISYLFHVRNAAAAGVLLPENIAAMIAGVEGIVIRHNLALQANISAPQDRKCLRGLRVTIPTDFPQADIAVKSFLEGVYAGMDRFRPLKNLVHDKRYIAEHQLVAETVREDLRLRLAEYGINY